MSNEIELFRWWMPPSAWRRQEYLSTHHMSREQAAAAGALRPQMTTRMVVRNVGETGRLGSAPPGEAWKENGPR